MMTQTGHPLLRAGTFSYVSCGFGLAGGAGSGKRKRRAGQNKGRDKGDEEREPKFHEDHYHLLPGNSRLRGLRENQIALTR